MKTFVVLRKPGSNWVKDLSVREQPQWDAHAAFMDALFESGAIILGGPYADHSAVLLIIQAQDDIAARKLLENDPWIQADILNVDHVNEWTIFLDSRQE